MLRAGCVRCGSPGLADAGEWICPEHGRGSALWRPGESSYDTFAQHLGAADGFPTYLPWPLSPGWRVSDFAFVGGSAGRAVATVACCSGVSDADGAIDALVVVEEPGTGLGGRVARLTGGDPGPEVAASAPLTRLRIGLQAVPMWSISTSDADAEFDRSVLAGEAAGRWLWLVLRPASAVLLLREEWTLRDAAGVGPPLVEVPFGGVGPAW